MNRFSTTCLRRCPHLTKSPLPLRTSAFNIILCSLRLSACVRILPTPPRLCGRPLWTAHKTGTRQSWVWSVSNLIVLASTYGGGWSILFLAASSSHRQCTVSALIISELAMGADGAEIPKRLSTPSLPSGLWASTYRLTIHYTTEHKGPSQHKGP